MVNRYRGEISARLDGRELVLCLTLGALAELEERFSSQNLNELVQRFSSGTLRASDMMHIVAAGLRGAGHTFSDDEVAQMQAEGGAVGYARIVGALLEATFGGDDPSRPKP
ncbi:MAG: gene transfer agent family protein [Ahrensia sp.]|nr:gene transfer agent family protein [Ahrensia sp.]